MLLCWLVLLPSPPGVRAQAGVGSPVVPCPGRPRCVMLVLDGTDTMLPPIFGAAITNNSINEIVLAGTRYVLRPSSWTVFTQQQPFRLTRNLTIRGVQVGMVLLLLPACVSARLQRSTAVGAQPAWHHDMACRARRLPASIPSARICVQQ